MLDANERGPEETDQDPLRASRAGGPRCYNCGYGKPGSVPGSAHMETVVSSLTSEL